MPNFLLFDDLLGKPVFVLGEGFENAVKITWIFCIAAVRIENRLKKTANFTIENAIIKQPKKFEKFIQNFQKYP